MFPLLDLRQGNHTPVFSNENCFAFIQLLVNSIESFKIFVLKWCAFLLIQYSLIFGTMYAFSLILSNIFLFFKGPGQKLLLQKLPT